MIEVPAGLLWWRTQPGGDRWLAALPDIVATVAHDWDLELGSLYPAREMMIGLVIAAVRDGVSVVLKVNCPNDESTHEADALAHWNGAGTARLLDYDHGRRALLLERLRPGTHLSTIEDEDAAYTAAAAVLQRLWGRPPGTGHPFTPLAARARDWAVSIPAAWEAHGRPFERVLIDAAVDACLALPDGSDDALLHQDLHGGNVLRDGAGWRAIDPKPLVGDRAFDVASLLRDRRNKLKGVDDARIIARRIDLLASCLDLDRTRMRAWGIAHALAWGEDAAAVSFDAAHVYLARLLHAAR